MNEKTLDYVRKQLEELRKPVFMGRMYNEKEAGDNGQEKETDTGTGAAEVPG